MEIRWGKVRRHILHCVVCSQVVTKSHKAKRGVSWPRGQPDTPFPPISSIETEHSKRRPLPHSSLSCPRWGEGFAISRSAKPVTGDRSQQAIHQYTAGKCHNKQAIHQYTAGQCHLVQAFNWLTWALLTITPVSGMANNTTLGLTNLAMIKGLEHRSKSFAEIF